MPTVRFDSFLAILMSQERWRMRPSLTLLDLDFDDGRHLLALAAALLSDADADASMSARVHYVVVVETWPEAGFDAQIAAFLTGQADTPFTKFCAQLRSAWLPRVPGFQRLVLADGRLILTLVAGTVAASLPQLTLLFDACYCRRADAVPTSIRWLGRLAAPDALLTMAADVSDDDLPVAHGIHKQLAQAGFAERETIGSDGMFHFAPRRLAGADGEGSESRNGSVGGATEKHAIVIGAGLAGAAACHRLSMRGWRCTLIECQVGPAQQASGNAAGIFMPVLSQDDNPLSRLTRAAYLFALHTWEGLGGVGGVLPGQACGVLQMARSDAASASALASASTSTSTGTPRTPWPYPADFARWMDSAEAAAALQRRVASGGWWFPAAGWLHPAAVCEAMLAACGDLLQIHYRRQARRLVRDGAQWQALDADGAVIASAPVVILANGVRAMEFSQAAHLPLSAIRGQVTHLPMTAQALQAALPPQTGMPFVICGDAYLTPAANGIASLGATYDQSTDAALRLADHQTNLRHLQQMLPDWPPPLDSAALDGRVGFRCVAADRLPLVGALPDPDRLHGSGDTRLPEMPRLPGLHALLGYGSRGLIWSPLAAELLAAQLNVEPSPLPRDLAALLDPARFALKQRRHAA